MPVIPATREAEAGELPELRKWRLQQAKIVPLHSSLGDIVRLHLKTREKNGKERKITFSEKKFRLAAKICISNKELNGNNGENVSRACQRSSWQPLPSQAQRPS